MKHTCRSVLVCILHTYLVLTVFFCCHQLKFTTAPVVSHYPPTQGQLAKAEFQADPSRTEKYDVSRYAFI